MVKLCLVSYYGPVETIELAENALRDQDIDVYDFPLYRYSHDANDKDEKYLDVFIKFIVDNEIDIVLWWFINIPTDRFKYIKEQTRTIYMFFNWDEPHNWSYCDIEKKMPYIDKAFVTCSGTLETYRRNGCEAFCQYPGYDPAINYIIETYNFDEYSKYACDISICCTNLYDDKSKYPDQYIERKKIIDTIYGAQKEFGFKFHIYGPGHFKKLYPGSYREFANYYDLNKIFNYSKINLCTHVLCNIPGYLNERLFLIGGSGGLALVDYVQGMEDVVVPNQHVIILDKHYYVHQIVNILANYSQYVRIRKQFNELCKTNYTYKEWGATIAHEIIKSTEKSNTL
jgi:hypothetical protein